jgi:hypothetical protein
VTDCVYITDLWAATVEVSGFSFQTASRWDDRRGIFCGLADLGLVEGALVPLVQVPVELFGSLFIVRMDGCRSLLPLRLFSSPFAYLHSL